MPVASLDHLVLTVRDPEATRRFYVEGLGMRWTEFGEGRLALGFGTQKINLHVAGREIEPKALRATPGSGDLCFLVDEPIEAVAERLGALASRSSQARRPRRAPRARSAPSTFATPTAT